MQFLNVFTASRLHRKPMRFLLFPDFKISRILIFKAVLCGASYIDELHLNPKIYSTGKPGLQNALI